MALEAYDFEPTLTDTQVVEFCKQGYLMLEGVVSEEINQRVCESVVGGFEDGRLLQEDWFLNDVILNPQAAGAVRSLLGKEFSTPVGLHNHRVECPAPSQHWHRDGGSRHEPGLNHLQVFYYPKDTPVELGPTEVLPSSHFLFCFQSWMGHYGNIKGAIKTAAPAGSIFLTAYPIWHRRPVSTGHGVRHMLKYLYWRTVPPERDWVIEPDFEPAAATYSRKGAASHPPRQQFDDWYDAAEMFFWLCGKSSELTAILGGEGWPAGYPPPRPDAQIYPPKGFHRF